jgi:hypothetical protein
MFHMQNLGLRPYTQIPWPRHRSIIRHLTNCPSLCQEDRVSFCTTPQLLPERVILALSLRMQYFKW